MNSSGRCYVKANYIKAAKENWVPCDVRLLSDDTDTFLCIKSRPLGFEKTEEDLKSIFSGLSAFGTISSTHPSQSSSTGGQLVRPFTALCNLSEYKSCNVLTVSVNDVGYFALKLVPAGIFGNKRLYLAMSSETEATSWMSMIKVNLGKKKKTGRNSLTQSGDSLVGAHLRTSGSQDTLRADGNTNICSRYDPDIDTIDNEVYEPCSSQDLIPSIVQQRGDWEKLHLSKLDCFLRLTDDRLELLDNNGERVLHWFPYLLIRRFGAVGGVLRVDAGRRCSTGDGHFFFTCSPPSGQSVDAICCQIRQLALEAKERLRQEQATRQQLQHNRHSFSSDMGSNNVHRPPIPTKSALASGGSTKTLNKPTERSPSPRGNSVASNSGVGGTWWSSRSAVDAGVSSPRATELSVEEKCGVFIASPAKANSIDRPAHERVSSMAISAPISGACLYDNVAVEETPTEKAILQRNPSPQVSQESKNIVADGQRRLRLRGETDESNDQSGALENSVRGRGTSSDVVAERQILHTTPPPPPPPEIVRNNGSNAAVLNGGTTTSGTSPTPAPKPISAYTPKTFNLISKRQVSEPSEPSRLSSSSQFRSYGAYVDNGDCSAESLGIPVSATLRTEPQRQPANKSSPIGVGVYEAGDNSFQPALRRSEDVSRFNMKGLDDVLQELRDANQNVSSAVQAAERQRRVQSPSTPFRNAISKSPVNFTRAMRRET